MDLTVKSYVKKTIHLYSDQLLLKIVIYNIAHKEFLRILFPMIDVSFYNLKCNTFFHYSKRQGQIMSSDAAERSQHMCCFR